MGVNQPLSQVDTHSRTCWTKNTVEIEGGAKACTHTRITSYQFYRCCVKRQSHIYHSLKVRPVSVAAVGKVKVNTDQLRCWLAGQCVFLSRLLKDRVLPPADKTFHLATEAQGFKLSGGFPSRPCGQGFQPLPHSFFHFSCPPSLLFSFLSVDSFCL